MYIYIFYFSYQIIVDIHVTMYIDRVPNRNSRPAILLREAWREGKKIRKRTIANLTNWPEEKVEALRLATQGIISGVPERGSKVVETGRQSGQRH